MFPVRDNVLGARFPFATVALISVNALAYVIVSLHGGSLISGPDTHEALRYGLAPHTVSHHWRDLVTAMFLHTSIVEFAGDVLFLWLFGSSVESTIGALRYLLLYFGAGLAAAGLQVALDSGSAVPTLGSAGAVAGVLGAYVVLYPRARVLTVVMIALFTVLELPAIALLAAWFAEQAAFAAANQGDGASVFLAGAGSFLAGGVVIRLLARGSSAAPRATLTGRA